MRTALLFILFNLSAVFASASQCRNFSDHIGDCRFYSECLEATYQCGPKAYPLGYAKKYCDRFMSINTPSNSHPFRGSLSSKGIKWRNSTMVCLQEKLVDAMLDKRLATCKEVHQVGFSTHVQCYTQGEISICDLSLKDKMVITSTVEAKDYFSKESITQVVGVMLSCAAGYNTKIQSIDFKIVLLDKQISKPESLALSPTNEAKTQIAIDRKVELLQEKKELLDQLNFVEQLKIKYKINN